MKKILAISGGIDSTVMLHKYKDDPDVIVAHFNHGTRPSADTDESFVRDLAKSYNLPFVSQKENLGPDCSEATARTRRYNFLRQIATKHKGEIYTAHHQDDLIESILINLIRGTGWRGLVPLSDPTIQRPLLGLTKSDIYKYATKNSLTFRQDPTNTEPSYLRNRLRRNLAITDKNAQNALLKLYIVSKPQKTEIDQILTQILPSNNTYQRAWFKTLDDPTAQEILSAALKKVNRPATRPQLQDFLAAIRTYTTGKKFNLGQNYLITINRNDFVLY